MTNKKGFSLLEILIAVAIMATSFVALLTAQGSSFLASERADRLTQATFLARQKMAEIEMEIDKDISKNKFPSDTDKDGTFDEPFDDFRWKYTIKKVEIPVIGGGESEDQNVMVGNYVKNLMDQLSKSVRSSTLLLPTLPFQSRLRLLYYI